MKEYRVVIVGSGPAGASCGKALKDEGIEALIVEKEKLPRHKICTGLVLGQGRMLVERYFGEAPPREVLSAPGTVHASECVVWDKEKGFSPYTMEIAKDGQTFSEEYLNVWRDKFDYWLLKKSGVEFREQCTFRGFSHEKDTVKVRLSHKAKGDEEVRCSYLVIADGVGSEVKKILDPSFPAEQAMILAAYQGYYRIVDMGELKNSHCYVFLEREFGDMFTIVHRKDDLLSLCPGGFKGRNMKKSMENLKTFLAKQFGVVLGDTERVEGCVIRVEPTVLGKDRVLLAGSAAGLIYLSGEGITPAIDSGYRAGKAICRAIKEGQNAFEVYEQDTKPIVNHMQVCLAQEQMCVPPHPA